MVVDQSFLKVRKILAIILLFIFCVNYSFAENFNLKKIINLKGPWGSSFISETELLITEKSGDIKLKIIMSIYLIPKIEETGKLVPP